MAAPAALEEWLDAVCAQVRFKPDRPGIRAELLAHLEDRETALTAGGWPEAEARAAAVAAMGDAAQVGAALDRAHSPLLGRLWLASVFVVALTLLVTVLFFLFGDGYAALRDRLDSYGSRADALAWLDQRRAGHGPHLRWGTAGPGAVCL